MHKILRGEIKMVNNFIKNPKINSYDFVKLLLSYLAIQGNTIIEKEKIVEILYKCSLKKENKELFEDIEFIKNIDGVVSHDIMDGLNSLQTFGVIGKLNPSYEKIIIYLSVDEAYMIINGFTNNELKEKIKVISHMFN